MTQRNSLRNILLVLLLAPLLFSCLPEIKKETVTYERPVTPAPALSGDIIDDRISELEEFLKRKDISQEDRDEALGLLSDYRKIRSTIGKDMSDQDYSDIIHVLIQSMDRFEDRYLLNREAVLEDQTLLTAVNELSLKKLEIQDSYLSGDFQGVISGCIELEERFGPDALTPDIGLIFAMALAENDMLKEAVDMGERIARDLEGKPDLIDLRSGIIEWLLAIGDRERALESYSKLVDNINEDSAVFSSVRSSIKPDTEVAVKEGDFSVDNYLPELVRLSDPERAMDLLENVDRLLNEKNYSEARLTLLRWRLRAEEAVEEKIIENALEHIELAEQIDSGERLPEPEDGSLKGVERLIEEERYEEAINSIEVLEKENINNSEINRLKNTAIEEIIKRDRDTAAQIFSQARKTDDPKKKEELLVSSLNILKTLIERYPSSDLINKLNSYLNTVKDELEKLRKGF